MKFASKASRITFRLLIRVRDRDGIYRHRWSNDLAGSRENCASRCTSHVHRKETLAFLFGTIFPAAAYLAGHIFCLRAVRFVPRMKVKTSYSLSFSSPPSRIWSHRIRSCWHACFRGSIDFYRPQLVVSCTRRAGRFVSIDRSIESIVNHFIRAALISLSWNDMIFYRRTFAELLSLLNLFAVNDQYTRIREEMAIFSVTSIFVARKR